VSRSVLRTAIIGMLLTAWSCQLALADAPRTVHFGVARIGGGIALHYAEAGQGMPLVFVHGSLSDYSYWKDEVTSFGLRYRAIAYSRRYNYPNSNAPHAGYSAITDADDLAGLVRALHLGKIVVVGHSYGALTALFFATRYPQLTRALVLAEPPAVSLLQHLPGSEAKAGEAMFVDIQTRMVVPMKSAYAEGDREAGVADFIDYVFNNSHAWEGMSPSSRAETMRDAHEWDVMMTRGTLFPSIDPQSIQTIQVPALLMTGDQTYPFLIMIDNELARLLPNNQNLIIHGAGHQMWFQEPQLCRDVVETFLHWSLR
jgi:non-heme chloroperoxidase